MHKELGTEVDRYITLKDLGQSYDLEKITYPELLKMFPDGPVRLEVIDLMRTKRGKWLELHPEQFQGSTFISQEGVVVGKKED